MNNRNDNRRNGYGRRREQNPEQGWSPQWSRYEENEPWGNTGRYGDPYGPESPIDFDQHQGYDDPYRDYREAPGRSRYGSSYSRRGDYRGNDPEFGYHQPGGPQGSSLYGPSWNQRQRPQWESQERGYPYGQGPDNTGYPPRREDFDRQEYSGPNQGRRSQGPDQGWSQGYEGPGSYTRERSYGYGGGSFGERPENRPGLNRDQGIRESSYRDSGWSTGRDQYGNRNQNEWNNEESSWGQPWNEGPYTGRGPKGYQRPDDRIREDVCERLSYHGFIDPSEVDINVEDGEVKLSGTCTSRREKRMIEDVVDSVRGVHDVNNNLSIDRSENSGRSGSTRLSSSNGEKEGSNSRSTSTSRRRSSKKNSQTA